MAEFQPPEGLRKIAHEAAYKAHAAGRFTVHQVVDAALAALFEACEVREEFGIRAGSYDLLGYTRKEAERVIAEEAAKGRTGHELLRRLHLTTPLESVSSTGEEPTGG